MNLTRVPRVRIPLSPPFKKASARKAGRGFFEFSRNGFERSSSALAATAADKYRAQRAIRTDRRRSRRSIPLSRIRVRTQFFPRFAPALPLGFAFSVRFAPWQGSAVAAPRTNAGTTEDPPTLAGTRTRSLQVRCGAIAVLPN